MNKKILIVEDEKKISDIVKTYLESNNFDVKTAYNGKEGLTLFDSENPDLILLDLMLPDMSGLELCTIIRSRSRTPMIMLTAKSEEEDILYGLDKGADDYITKPFSLKELLARVKTVLRRAENELIPLTDEISLYSGKVIINNLKHEVRVDGNLVNITPNEYSLLMTMLSAPNKTFTRTELIDFAFKEEYDGFDRSIDTHIKNIRKKIMPNIIKTVHGVGYKFGGEDNEI